MDNAGWPSVTCSHGINTQWQDCVSCLREEVERLRAALARPSTGGGATPGPEEEVGEPDFQEAYRRWWSWASRFGVKMKFVCKECGEGGYSDEDGCCASCGWTLVVVPDDDATPADPGRLDPATVEACAKLLEHVPLCKGACMACAGAFRIRELGGRALSQGTLNAGETAKTAALTMSVTVSPDAARELFGIEPSATREGQEDMEPESESVGATPPEAKDVTEVGCPKHRAGVHKWCSDACWVAGKHIEPSPTKDGAACHPTTPGEPKP